MNRNPPPDLRKTIDLASTLALRQVILEMAPIAGKFDLRSSFAPTKLLLERLRQGEHADVVLLTKDGVLQLIDEGILRPGYHDIAISQVGIAQAMGSADLDIGTVDNLREVLVKAKSVAYSVSGASGFFFAELIKQLGIEHLVKKKAVISPGGFTGELVVEGKAEIAVQQMSELHSVNGLGTITALPEEAQCLTVFSAATSTRSVHSDAVDVIVSILKSEDGRRRLRALGLQAVPL